MVSFRVVFVDFLSARKMSSQVPLCINLYALCKIMSVVELYAYVVASCVYFNLCSIFTGDVAKEV